MNDINPTFPDPEWAEDSTLDKDGRSLDHRSPNLSSEPGISVHFERLDRLNDQNEFQEGFHAICLEAEGNGRYQGSTQQIDLDEDPMGDPASLARRIAAQLVVAADALDKARGVNA